MFNGTTHNDKSVFNSIKDKDHALNVECDKPIPYYSIYYWTDADFARNGVDINDPSTHKKMYAIWTIVDSDMDYIKKRVEGICKLLPNCRFADIVGSDLIRLSRPLTYEEAQKIAKVLDAYVNA